MHTKIIFQYGTKVWNGHRCFFVFYFGFDFEILTLQSKFGISIRNFDFELEILSLISKFRISGSKSKTRNFEGSTLLDFKKLITYKKHYKFFQCCTKAWKCGKAPFIPFFGFKLRISTLNSKLSISTGNFVFVLEILCLS